LFKIVNHWHAGGFTPPLMNTRQENKLSMYVSVQSLLEGNQTVWQTLPAFGSAFTAFKGSIQRINSLEQSRQTGTRGVTAAKQAAREGMASAALIVAGAVRAYASKNNDQELLAKVDFTSSNILRGRDTEAATICQGIHDSANGVVANLADFGVDAAGLTALQGKIDAYSAVLGSPRSRASTHRAAAGLKDDEFTAADRVLEEQLDGLVENFRVSQPSFYEAYQAARDVVENASGHSNAENNTQPQPQPA
jgi:hypothetical protein